MITFKDADSVHTRFALVTVHACCPIAKIEHTEPKRKEKDSEDNNHLDTARKSGIGSVHDVSMGSSSRT